MKYKLRIGEFAKLKNVTTETLRHYDRVGLLKPVEVDPETGYRYYTVFQSEKLATIIELKLLGFSIEEMKDFLNDRQLQSTYALLNERHHQLLTKIEEMKALEKSLSRKLAKLSDLMALEETDGYVIKTLAAQRIVFMEPVVEDHVTFEWLASDMENQLINIHPVVGTDAYGILMPGHVFSQGKLFDQTHLIYFLDEDVEIKKGVIQELPERTVACFLIRRPREGFDKHVNRIIEILNEDGYKINGDVLVRFRITTMITEVASEQLYEFQVPIE